MQRNTSLLYTAASLFLLCFAPICCSAQNFVKDRQTERRRSTIKFCDPSLSNQTAGGAAQKCLPGFYREWTGSHRGQCVPCSCNGLSKECDEQTGNCVNCQFNTTGDHCERCKEGYYGNAAKRTCRACPCPFMQNNFALACMDVGSGVVECLCRRGYSGARCERCAYGYYGNPLVNGGNCKPCNCKNRGLNICDSLTGQCLPSGNSSSDDPCHKRGSCTYTLLVDLEKMDGVLAWMGQQLQNISLGPASLSSLNNLEADISKTKIQVGRFSTAVKHLHPKVEQLDADVDVVRPDLSELTDETLKTTSDLEKVFQNANETKLKAEDLLSEAEALLTVIRELIKQLTEVKPGDSVSLSEKHKGRMMEEAQRNMQKMRERNCIAQRDKAGREQGKVQELLDFIRNMTDPAETNQAVLNQTADSVMASDFALRDLAEQLLNAEDTVDRTQGLNLKSQTTLQQVQNLHAQLEQEQSTLLPVTEMTKDLLKNISGIFSVLEEIKQEFENEAAQADGAKRELLKKLNNVFISMDKVDAVAKAEENAEELNRLATELEQVLHNATNSSELLNAVGIGAYNSITNAIEKAEVAANQSRDTADGALEDTKEGGLVNRADGLKDNSTHLWREANDTQSHLKVNSLKDRVNKQKEKGESMEVDLSAVSDQIKQIKRGDTQALIESVKTAASAVNSTVSNVEDRLRNISQELEGIKLTNVSKNTGDIWTDADEALKNFNRTFPVLSDKLAEVEALSGKTSPNMTESIRRIKDIIEETRNFVNRLSITATFNGKGHIELHPPRNLEDIKAFTSVDLLLNRHGNDPSNTGQRRKRRQNRHIANLFVFYLGNKDASGDYIGMAVRDSVLVCVYKLGGVVHEVETSPITITNANSSHFDRVIFHRVYQDAEVNITQNFLSQKSINLPPKRNLPDTMAGVLGLDPDSVVFYVGGYPEGFIPPVELRYHRYRGAMKLSYINDNPVCLFNYKHAINMDAKQLTVKIPQSEVSDFYEGTGYRMALIKEPAKKKKRLIKFHTNSRETNALLFYIGNEDSFVCLFLERGFLVLQGRQADRDLSVQTSERVSLFNKQFAISIANAFVVHCGTTTISTDHIDANYRSYYIGGLPAELRQRHNITAAPLRGCVDHLTEDAEIVAYSRTIGVSDGCPVSLLGVRAATLNSTLSGDSLFVWNEQPLRVSLGFRSTDRQGVLLQSSYQGSSLVRDLQLSLADGFVVFNCYNYTLKSHKRYSDGAWHYLSAVGRPTGLELSIDNEDVIPGKSPVTGRQEGIFKGCIANLYTRPEHSFVPADLSALSQTGNVELGQCSLHPPPDSELLPAPVLKKPQKRKPTQAPAGSHCGQQQTRCEYQLSEEHSWISYDLPLQDLNYRPHFSLDIKTNSSKGLIFHVAGRGVVPLLALYMANGKIKMSLGQNRIIQHKERSNDGDWHRVELSVEKSSFHLLVDGIRVTDGNLSNDEGSALDLLNPVYLGGDPTSRATKGHNIPMKSLISCVRDFRMNDVVVGEPEASNKILPC
ncbi:laminin subunit alpha-3 isoform X3 [Amphiprion ocellaris]|uniref:laminin subunit alpha-3 isoform X3 n=1 Tax=Amphiprion ocellaris TaxID=80972 RepID=UPI002411538C|nr:laminin subunit alpha-3 isoform X3 [Amphiprion ocellaris]